MSVGRVRSAVSRDGPVRAWPAAGGAWGRARAAVRVGGVLLLTLVSAAVQAVCLVLPGRAKVRFARWYWAAMSRVMGMRIRVLGSAAGGMARRPVVYASNHTSWLDVLVLGGTLEACFVAKAEVAGWPLVRTVARLGRTVFVSRRARDTGRERDAMRERLRSGDDLILFPEGTSSDGSRVLPFRSAFFSVVETTDGTHGPLIQPVSVVYDRLGGLPIGRASRAVFAWYGDMELGPHVWRLAHERGLRATVVLHAPLDPADFGSRKAMAAAVWEVVAAGAGGLRQNRAAQGSDVRSGQAAFA